MRPKNPVTVGRTEEISILDQALQSNSAEFIAVYGRRRVGKTHLIREFFKPKATTYFSVTGLKDGTYEDQLQLFQEEIENVFLKKTRIPQLMNWREAFGLLVSLVEQRYGENKSAPLILFLDELPWLATARSGFIQALDHAWNTQLVQIPTVTLIVCGSAAAWMIDHLIQAKGGLHHRITRKIQLQPFSLAETEEYLTYLGVRLKRQQILEIYMAIGGIPHYLKQVQKGISAKQVITKICFSRNGYLRDEFKLLFQSLFDQSENHLKIIQALTTKKLGLTRNEIIQATEISSGGRLAKWLDELEQAGFITSIHAYGKPDNNVFYRIIDEYVWFYMKWIKKAPRGDEAESYWERVSHTPSYAAWSRFAFEAVCMKHRAQIKKALDIQGVTLQTNAWTYAAKKGNAQDKGAQVDILFDRSDNAITLGEIKYCATEYTLDKAYAVELKNKIVLFGEKTKTKKQIFLALISPFGMKPSIWSNGLIDQIVTTDDLFSP